MFERIKISSASGICNDTMDKTFAVVIPFAADDNVHLVHQFYAEAMDCKCYFKERWLNPTQKETTDMFQVANRGFEFNVSKIYNFTKIWLSEMNDKVRQDMSRAVFESLQHVQQAGINQTMLENYFIKMMFWTKKYLLPAAKVIASGKRPRVMYDCSQCGKYEIEMLHILQRIGANVLIIYEDTTGFPIEYFNVIGAVGRKTAYETYDPELHQIAEDLKQSRQQVRLQYQAITQDMLADRLKAEKRFDENAVECVNCCIIGEDNHEQFKNQLFFIHQSIKKRGNYLISSHIPNPAYQDTLIFQKETVSQKEDLIILMTKYIGQNHPSPRISFVKRAFADAMMAQKEENITKLYNKCVKVICWLNQFVNPLFLKDTVPVIWFYGEITENDVIFADICTRLPADLICTCTDKQKITPQVRQIANMQVIELSGSCSIYNIPEREEKVKASTVAHHAEQEIRGVLYQDTGLYMDNQFNMCSNVLLNTTFDEIAILWKQETKFRPFFSADAQMVKVPNIFAKIVGVPEGNKDNYVKYIKNCLTEETILISRLPFLHSGQMQDRPFIQPPVVQGIVPPIQQNVQNQPSCIDMDRDGQLRFIKNNKVMAKSIVQQPFYSYDYIRQETQDLMFNKIQELLDIGGFLFDGDPVSFQQKLLQTLLYLDKNTLNWIQWVDYTKQLPKVIVIDNTEAVPSLEECIYLAYLSLIGFDILVFVPTGYRSIDKYLHDKMYVEHTVGPVMFDMNSNEIRVKRPGLINKFRRPRN